MLCSDMYHKTEAGGCHNKKKNAGIKLVNK